MRPVFLRMDNDELVNADCIGRIVRVGQGHSARFAAYDRDGSRLGMLGWGFDVQMLDPVIPAAGQIYAAVIKSYEQEDGTWETWVDYTLIVGWRFESEFAEPVLAEDAYDALVALPAGDGLWSVPGDIAGTLEDLKRAALHRAQREKAEVEERMRKAAEAAA